jgi:hypothetical protein
MNSLPVHISHMNAEHSGNVLSFFSVFEISVFNGVMSKYKKEWIPHTVWSRFEYDLIMKSKKIFLRKF